MNVRELISKVSFFKLSIGYLILLTITTIALIYTDCTVNVSKWFYVVLVIFALYNCVYAISIFTSKDI